MLNEKHELQDYDWEQKAMEASARALASVNKALTSVNRALASHRSGSLVSPATVARPHKTRAATTNNVGAKNQRATQTKAPKARVAIRKGKKKASSAR